MIWSFVSRYRPRYARSLTYMLQVCEYNAGDYLKWYHRTTNFAAVEKRGRLKRTIKANVIEAFIAAMLIAIYVTSLTALQLRPPIFGFGLALLGILIAPYAGAYLILLPLFVVRFAIQYPTEHVITHRARRRLAASDAQVLAVAGSFGKTSMREILRTVLAEGRRVSAPPHSYNTPLGISKFISRLNGEEEVLVFELGEYYPGDVKRLCQLVNPALGIITGVNEAHLSKFKRLDRTTSTIFELADWLGSGPVYVNGDSPQAAAAARPTHLVYTKDGVGDWQVKHARTGLTGTAFDLVSPHKTIRVRSQLLGLHQIGPLSAAAHIAERLGLTIPQIELGLSKVKPFEHRLQPSTGPDGVVTLDDSYNGNPDGVRAVISFLASLSGHRRIYVTPGLVEMGHRTRAVHESIGSQLAAGGIEMVVLIRNSVTPIIEQGLRSAGYAGNLVWFDDGPAAMEALPQLTRSGDVVLLQNDWPDQYA